MTAAAVNALSVEPVRHRELISAGLDFLAGSQHADGNFDPAWSASRFHTIFRAILAATWTKSRPSVRWLAMTKRGLAAVCDGQNPDGGWGQQVNDPSDAVSTSYALIAMCHQENHRPVVRGFDFLLSAQRNGAIVSIPDSVGPRPFIFSLPVLADTFALLAFGHLASRVEPRSEDFFDSFSDVEISIKKAVPMSCDLIPPALGRP
jgi:squalene-hopene/tetraprenyl-beta-curcumene cyclase